MNQPGPGALGPGDPAAPTTLSTEIASDVTEFEAVSPANVPPGPIVQDVSVSPTVEPYNPVENLDKVRSQLAFRLIWTLVGVIVAGVVLLLTAPLTGVDKIANIGTTAVTVFSSMVTLVSAATGFYFGQSQSGGGK